MGQTSEDIAQISVGIKATTTAAFDHGVKNSAAFAGLGFSDEEPVLLSNGGGTNGVFHEVVVDLNAAIFDEHFQHRPLRQRVINGAAQKALRENAAGEFKRGERPVQTLDDESTFPFSHGLPPSRTGSMLPQRGFDLV